MNIKNFMKYFKERVLLYFKIFKIFLIFQTEIFHRASVSATMSVEHFFTQAIICIDRSMTWL